jgi:hypothetical protein
VRQGEALGAELQVAEEQDVDVDRPRAVAQAALHATELVLDGLARIQELERLEGRPDADAGVEEVVLVQDLADRVRVVRRGGRRDAHPVRTERVDRALQVAAAVPDVGPQAEVPGALAHRRGPGIGRSSASWRLCASRMPSGVQIPPSSSK